MKIKAEQIIATLKEKLEPHSYVHAMWLGGPAAWDRVDQWSDIDIQVDVDDDSVEKTFAIVEEALESLSPIYLKYRLPSPTWHGHEQSFYRLKDTSEYLFIDFVVIKHSSDRRFNEKEQHGIAPIVFDKANVVCIASLDKRELNKTLKKRLTVLRTTFELFQVLVKKEIKRGHPLEAMSFYHNMTLRPLVELLRIKHCPQRYSFHTRYIDRDLPDALNEKLQSLFFVGSLEELTDKHKQAEEFFYREYQKVNIQD